MKQQRRTHSSEFKSKVALEALKDRKTLSEIASEYQVQINTIKCQTLRRLQFERYASKPIST